MSQPSPSPTPPLLLTKRLNAFLRANQTPLLPTLLLTSAHGKLLAHASPQPVSLLRTHATVAASLAIHAAASPDVPSALSGARTPPDAAAASSVPAARGRGNARDDDDDSDDDDDDDDGAAAAAAERQHDDAEERSQARRCARAARLIKPLPITVQLSGSTVIIRRLRCGLLFVSVGPLAHEHQADNHAHHDNGDPTGSPSEAESMASAASVVAMRRHAGELAHWLNDKLGTLRVPEEDGSIVSD